MLKELSSWAVSQYRTCTENGVEIPSEYKEFLHSMQECSGQIVHWGGRVDLQPLIEKERSFNLVAAFLAIEISARTGVATLLHPLNVRQTCSLISLYIVYEGLIAGVTPEHLASSWQHALTNAPKYTDMGNKDRALIAGSLHHWVSQCLDHPSSTVTWEMNDLLSAGRLQLGDVWYWGTLRYSAAYGSLVWLTAIQSIEEILNPHIKAASKRLRWQQVQRIQIEAPHCLKGSAEDLRYWIATYVLTHEWSADLTSSDWESENAPALRTIMAAIEFQWSVQKTEQMWIQVLQEWPALFVGVSHSQVAKISDLPLDKWTVRQAEHRRLKSMIQHCQRSSNQTTQAQIDSFEMCFPVEVRLLTTRGGTWPERRERIVWSVFRSE